jgi:predicted small lipoprotein YifL
LTSRLTASNRPIRRRVAAGLLLAFLVLSGCGQKGDLYIPDLDPADEIQLDDPV